MQPEDVVAAALAIDSRQSSEHEAWLPGNARDLQVSPLRGDAEHRSHPGDHADGVFAKRDKIAAQRKKSTNIVKNLSLSPGAH